MTIVSHFTTFFLFSVTLSRMNLDYNPSYTPIRTRKLIISKYLNGEDKQQIADQFALKLSTINTYIRRYGRTGTVLTPYELKKERKEPITRTKKFDNYAIQSYTDQSCLSKPSTTLSKYQSDIYGKFGIYVSRGIIDKYFRDKGWKWKKISRLAFEADINEEYGFWQYMQQIVGDKKQLVFVDESNRFDTTVNKKRGRGPGRVFEKVAFTRGGYKFSLLSAISSDGVVVYEVYPGAVNEDKFNGFMVNRLMDYVNPYPGDRSIILLDNITFHHNEVFKDIFFEYGSMAVYLPHYQPTLNLMEYGFRDIKAMEVSKGIYGEQEGLMSLIESVERIKNKDYTDILRTLGYI